MRLLILFIALIGNLQAQTQLPGPWRFGMTKAEVSSFKDFGPYLDVAVTGGIETYNAIFNSQKTNVSFIFDEKGLKRIQVWAYEGRSKEDAAKAWASLYTFLKKNHGAIEIPQMKLDSKTESLPPEVLGFTVMVQVGLVGKVQMAPVKMPPDVNIFSSFVSNGSIDKPIFLLLLFYDRT